MKTSAHTLSNHPMPQSLSLALSTWILPAKILLRRKGKVSLTTKRNTESVEIEKWLKRLPETYVKRCCLSTARSAEASISIYSQIQLRLKQAKRCCLSTASQSPCNVCTQACPKIVNHLGFTILQLQSLTLLSPPDTANISPVIDQLACHITSEKVLST